VGATRIAEFTEEKLKGEADLDGADIHARLSGTASQREVVTLDTFLGVIVREATRGAPDGAVTTVWLDLRDLHYMNSSHFKLLVSLVSKLKKSGLPLGLRLKTNETYHWQKRSLPALKHLADDLVSIE
jgi:hypothetical protein